MSPEESDTFPPAVITAFLCGDVMTGRGIDQVLPHPCEPEIHEAYLRSALGYVQLAEAVNGPIARPVAYSYIWGDALAVLAEQQPDLRIVNLETSVTTSSDFWPDKGINYRMHPENIGCLTAAGIDCCTLANNHVLDWGRAGLAETLEVLQQAGIASTGAGRDRQQAETPAIFPLPGKGRLLVFAWGSGTSGVPPDWAAGPARSGINLLPDFSDDTLARIQTAVAAARQPRDVVLLSLHWGGNWGYHVPAEERRFAHHLIDEAGVDAVYGHSSHHPKGIEVYRDRLILYGCGDFLNDYEGISGYAQFRADLTLMYFPAFEASSGRLARLNLVPMRIKRLQAVRPGPDDCRWLAGILNREGQQFGTRVEPAGEQMLSLKWD
jgi:poly-gamma-glutamate synthesis protein (capsule biosynthesis protein)